MPNASEFGYERAESIREVESHQEKESGGSHAMRKEDEE
jgi:hypothetical protein